MGDPDEIGSHTSLELLVVIIRMRGAVEGYWSSVEMFGGRVADKCYLEINEKDY